MRMFTSRKKEQVLALSLAFVLGLLAPWAAVSADKVDPSNIGGIDKDHGDGGEKPKETNDGVDPNEDNNNSDKNPTKPENPEKPGSQPTKPGNSGSASGNTEPTNAPVETLETLPTTENPSDTTGGHVSAEPQPDTGYGDDSSDEDYDIADLNEESLGDIEFILPNGEKSFYTLPEDHLWPTHVFGYEMKKTEVGTFYVLREPSLFGIFPDFLLCLDNGMNQYELYSFDPETHRIAPWLEPLVYQQGTDSYLLFALPAEYLMPLDYRLTQAKINGAKLEVFFFSNNGRDVTNEEPAQALDFEKTFGEAKELKEYDELYASYDSGVSKRFYVLGAQILGGQVGADGSNTGAENLSESERPAMQVAPLVRATGLKVAAPAFYQIDTRGENLALNPASALKLRATLRGNTAETLLKLEDKIPDGIAGNHDDELDFNGLKNALVAALLEAGSHDASSPEATSANSNHSNNSNEENLRQPANTAAPNAPAAPASPATAAAPQATPQTTTQAVQVPAIATSHTTQQSSSTNTEALASSQARVSAVGAVNSLPSVSGRSEVVSRGIRIFDYLTYVIVALLVLFIAILLVGLRSRSRRSAEDLEEIENPYLDAARANQEQNGVRTPNFNPQPGNRTVNPDLHNLEPRYMDFAPPPPVAADPSAAAQQDPFRAGARQQFQAKSDDLDIDALADVYYNGFASERKDQDQ